MGRSFSVVLSINLFLGSAFSLTEKHQKVEILDGLGFKPLVLDLKSSDCILGSCFIRLILECNYYL